jgi:hypothetical protein
MKTANFHFLWWTVIIAFASGCDSAPVPKSSKNAGATASSSNSTATKSPVVDWCSKGKEMPLGKWKEAGETMRVTYCEYDSTDGNGYRQSAGLDVRQQNLSTSQAIWKIHDETKVAMTSLKVFRPTFEMLDIDGDGKMETFFGYNLVSDGAEAIPVKFMTHMGGKKFAIRGAIPMTEDDSSSFKMEFDPAFASAPPRLKVVADSLFRKFAVRLCVDPDLGYGIPVPPQLRR